MSDYRVYPYHMQRKKSAGDVTFARRTLTGSFAIAQTNLDEQGKIIPKNLMVKFESGGSGFILKKLENPIKVKNENSYISALILTAGHVVCDTTTFQFDKDRFSCYLTDRNIDVEAIPLKYFMKDFNSPMISTTNQNFYMYPGDLALLLLISNEKNLQLNELPIPTDISFCNGLPVRMAGFPKTPENFEYCCPSLKNESESDVKKKISKAFHGFSHLVYSDGKIIGTSQQLLDITCAGTNGMSGGPIIADNALVGVYVGGPPLPGQFELFCISQLIHNDQFSEAFNSLDQLLYRINSLYEKLSLCDSLRILILQISLLDYLIRGETKFNLVFMQDLEIKNETIKNFFKFLLKEYQGFLHQKQFEFIELKLGHIFGKSSDFVLILNEIVKISENLKNPLIEELKNKLILLAYLEIILKQEGLQKLFEIINQIDYEKIVIKFLEGKFKLLKKRFDSECADQAYSMVIDYKFPENLTFNVGISLNHPAFAKIIEFVGKINENSGAEFNSIEEFMNCIG